ncbi:hypothetical protein LSAT2_015688 [Lamellibrachia satsuma]|nr:hypothetical protein LSAT2_015688 [Lamellibrachia satsuma]
MTKSRCPPSGDDKVSVSSKCICGCGRWQDIEWLDKHGPFPSIPAAVSPISDYPAEVEVLQRCQKPG